MVTQVNTGGIITNDTMVLTVPTVDNEQLPRTADMETEVSSSPAKPGAVASDLVEVTVAAAVTTVDTPLDSPETKCWGVQVPTLTRIRGCSMPLTPGRTLPEAPADQGADVLMPHAGLINSVSAIGEGPSVAVLAAPVTLDLSGDQGARRMRRCCSVLARADTMLVLRVSDLARCCCCGCI